MVSKGMAEFFSAEKWFNMIETVKCSLCGWEWQPRVELPRECPKCKRHDWKGVNNA